MYGINGCVTPKGIRKINVKREYFVRGIRELTIKSPKINDYKHLEQGARGRACFLKSLLEACDTRFCLLFCFGEAVPKPYLVQIKWVLYYAGRGYPNP